MKHQTRTVRLRLERDATSHAAVNVTIIAGHCSPFSSASILGRNVPPSGAVPSVSLQRPRRLEDEAQGVVALVAGEFQQRLVSEGQMGFAAPWTYVPGRILDSEAIVQLLLRDARESFGEDAARRDEICAGRQSAHSIARREEHRFDDERLAFPPADRIAEP